MTNKEARESARELLMQHEAGRIYLRVDVRDLLQFIIRTAQEKKS